MKKEVLEKLIELLKIDSFAFKKHEVVEAQNFVKNYLRDLPINWIEYSSTDPQLAPLLVGKSKNWDEAKPSITLDGHLDIVYPDTSGFKVEVRGDKLFGPGTADMKAGIMVILEAVKALHKSGDFRNMILLFTSEEEHFRTASYPDFANIASAIDTLLVYEGEGSITELQNPREKLLVTKRKGILAYKLKANGPGGHSGALFREEERHSTINELINQATKAIDLADYSKGTTTNVGIFRGGEALNIIAPEAEIVFDARLDSVSEYDRVKEAVESFSSKDPLVKLESELLVSGFPVEESTGNKQLFELAQKVGKELDIEVGFVHKGGASDMNRITSFKPEIAALDYLGPSGGGEHTKNEFLFLDSFDPSLELSVGLIREIQKNL